MKQTPEFSTQPLAAMTMIATVALALASGAVIAPALIVGAVALHSFADWPKLGRPRTYHALILAVPFALWWREYSDDAAMNEQVPIGLLFIIGLFMCALGARHLLAHRRGGNMEYTLACAVMGFALAGTIQRQDGSSRWYLPMLAAFIVLLLVHLRATTVGGVKHRIAFGTSMRHAGALGLLILLTAAFEVYVVRQLPALNRWAVAAMLTHAAPPSPGFSRSAQLGAIRDVWNRTRDNVVVMRVFAAKSPEYLRGAAFDYYEQGPGRWSLIEEDRTLMPEGTFWNRSVFDALRASEEDVAPSLAGMIYPEDELDDTFFVPPGTHRVCAFVERARYGRAYTIRPEEGDGSGGYGYFEPTQAQPPPTSRDLHVPFRLRWRLMQISDRFVPVNDSPQRKIEAIVRHFQDEYAYGFERDIPPDADPVVSFLENPGEGHCEFFAASATLLLRVHGIPARYVTGFVCREAGDGDDLWIVRRRDAHAWVEAYLPDRGWFVVEATPADARPGVDQAEGWGATRQWWASQWTRLTRMLRHGGFTAAVGSLLDFLSSIPQRLPTWGWALLIAVGAGWTFRHDLRAMLSRRRAGDVPRSVLALQQKLAEAERMLAKHGLVRPPAQSVGEFIGRLDGAGAIPDTIRDRARGLLDEYQRDRFRRHA